MTPASYRDVRRYLIDGIDEELIVRAARSVGMKVREATFAHTTLTAHMNIWSFGENVTVALCRIDDATLIDITSTCRMSTQIADWGKNRRNVLRLFDSIEALLGATGEKADALVCDACGYLVAGATADVCPECGTKPEPAKAPKRSHLPALWSGVMLVSVVTGIELATLFAFRAVGFRPPFQSVFGGRYGAIQLFVVNIVSVAVILVLHAVVSRSSHRR